MAHARTEGRTEGAAARADADERIVRTIKGLAMDAVEAARCGHPGMPMGAADFATVLWTRHLRYDPLRADWPDRDRFVLSAGHGSMLLYALLHLAGFDLPIEELRTFRQWGSRTPGHPERGLTPGVETTTGPLGQGFGNSVGMAIAEAHLAARFNVGGHRIVDHRTFVLASDGDLMEGVASEAASLAGHLRLGRLIVFYDDNRVTIDGPTSLAFSEDAGRRFEAYGWHVQRIDGHDREACDAALRAAIAETDRPSLLVGRTHIAHGAPTKQDSSAAHGAPLGPDEVAAVKRAMGWPEEPFHVPDDVRAVFARRAADGREASRAWDARLAGLRRDRPDLARDWDDRWSRRLPDDLDAALPDFAGRKPIATRVASGECLQVLASRVPALIGGSADLASSTMTLLKDEPAFSAARRDGRILHWGVREHAMGAALNGLAQHGGLRPFGGTFLIFSDYMRPAIRLAALSHLPVVYVFTHDSVFLGEDGPTHQPIEHLASLRATPNLVLIRPADARETAAAWSIALRRDDGPTALALTRQAVPVLDGTGGPGAGRVERGAYPLLGGDVADPDLLLLASGSEVAPTLEAGRRLAAEGVRARVVSFPSWELFARQPRARRDEVLPPACARRLAVEAAAPFGWDRWVGPHGDVLGIDRFGASAPWQVIAEKLDFTAEAILARARRLLDGRAGGA